MGERENHLKGTGPVSYHAQVLHACIETAKDGESRDENERLTRNGKVKKIPGEVRIDAFGKEKQNLEVEGKTKVRIV